MCTITILQLEEKFSHLEFHADDMHVYSLYVSNRSNCMLDTQRLLISWLKKNGAFPLYLYISVYDDMNLTEELERQQIIFVKKMIEEQPIFEVKLNDMTDVDKVIGQFFYMSAHSEIMMITTEAVQISMCNSINMLSATMPSEEYIMIVEHDGQGLQLLTTKEEWLQEEGILKSVNGIISENCKEKYYGLTK